MKKKKKTRHGSARLRLNGPTFIRSERRERLNNSGTKRETPADLEVEEVRLFSEGRMPPNKIQMLTTQAKKKGSRAARHHNRLDSKNVCLHCNNEPKCTIERQ